MIAAEGISIRRGRRQVVTGVDLTIERGQVLALLGPNGAGKSTLLECLGGVVRPSAGRVVRDGRVATVLQTPGLARRSVRANVELALAWWGVPRARRRPRAMEALEQMRAAHLARRPTAALSGGERRRVHVARGVAVAPDVLLLDEPFAGLDGETHQALVEDTSSVLREASGAVVVVVHDRADAWALADRVAVMLEGRVAALGPPTELLAAPPDEQVARFLGFDGRLERSGEVLLTRPAHVRPGGRRAGTVSRVIGQEDGVMAEVRLQDGAVRCRFPDRVTVGDVVHVEVTGGVTFPIASPSGGVPADR